MSRQHIYNQKSEVEEYISSLDSEISNEESIVLNRNLYERAILSLSLDCHGTIEGVQRFFASIFNKHVSVGYISGILKEAARRAEEYDNTINLETIRQGANDEIFQGDIPILTGVDPETTYIYLLAEAGDRTADTWQLYMEDRKEHGLNLETSISDAGTGLLAGIPRAFPDSKLQLDTFHSLRSLGVEIFQTERKAYSLIGEEANLGKRIQGKRPRPKTIELEKQIHTKVQEAIDLYDVLYILFSWIRELLGFSGYGVEDTLFLVQSIFLEMRCVAKERTALLERIDKFERDLPSLLCFIRRLFDEMERCAKEQGIPLDAFHLMYQQLSYGMDSQPYQQIEYQLVKLLWNDYDRTREAFAGILTRIKKASSLVENVNGRIRTYINIKRIIPTGFFVLMKVYLNTKRYRRSRYKERIGKSPLELLTNQEQPQFLEAIGY